MVFLFLKTKQVGGNAVLIPASVGSALTGLSDSTYSICLSALPWLGMVWFGLAWHSQEDEGDEVGEGLGHLA